MHRLPLHPGATTGGAPASVPRPRDLHTCGRRGRRPSKSSPTTHLEIETFWLGDLFRGGRGESGVSPLASFAFPAPLPQLLRGTKNRNKRLHAPLRPAATGTEARVDLYPHLSCGRACWVHDLVTKEGKRSRGYGQAIMRYVESWAKERGCSGVCVYTKINRKDALRFYETTWSTRSLRSSTIEPSNLGAAPK
jgi:GNAT superfamily N-acetyltransferase